MKRGTNVRLINGKDSGVILLSPSNVDGMTMCMVGWGMVFGGSVPRYTWERMEDLVCL